MLLKKEREHIVEYGKKLIQAGLTKGTGGNISIFNREEGLMAISPSGLDYFQTEPEDVVVLNLAGEIVDGARKPSSELEMHSIFYKKREDVNAIVHTHSPFATTISALQWELPAASYLVAYAGYNVRCAKYATFGTTELAEYAFEAMIDRYAVLLANHGLLAGGFDIVNAFNIAEEIEFSAEVYYRAKSIGEPVIIPDEEMKILAEKFKSYGQMSTKRND
ncbi:L-fuculose-phosphate aldolase [Ammoniphilus sp. CFH 90114]|uniref:L-fuculose-phosphate aldolase n=1 Tax=Ammoniphilus sp. CFH 90114 TaxID=2493665 RepID=UPI00100F79CA|nr:L-fuculose-phosphate aldolase [Ammoniphilus sp. CFH 90114]RXT06369.1 L-fuculose-phosphate aldolase [Ammoniphilus sp. CFH 90114]